MTINQTYTDQDIAMNKKLAYDLELQFLKFNTNRNCSILASNDALEVIRPNRITHLPYDMQPALFYGECMQIALEFNL